MVSVIILVGLFTARGRLVDAERNRDATRSTKLLEMTSFLENYYAATGKYPEKLNLDDVIFAKERLYSKNKNVTSEVQLGDFLQPTPIGQESDESMTSYCYKLVNNGNDYIIGVKLEFSRQWRYLSSKRQILETCTERDTVRPGIPPTPDSLDYQDTI